MNPDSKHSLRADVVVVGGGLAAAQLVHSLRDSGYSGTVLLISSESKHPYHRPPLSKAYLDGSFPSARLWLRNPTSYQEKNIDVALGVEVVGIDRQARTVTLNDGRSLEFGRLVLATGARNRTLPGLSDLDGVYSLRSWEEADTLIENSKSADSIAILGGGFLGLEMAHVFNKAGKRVTVLEMASRLLARTSSKSISNAVLDVHIAAGVDVKTNCTYTDVVKEADGFTLNLSTGEALRADLIVTNIGVVPNDSLAESAGLSVDNGIVVDEFLTTSDPNIFAIGDCVRFPCPWSPTPVRLESVQNATDQAKCLAISLSSANRRAYDALPWFWSDQGIKLQIAGLVSSAEEFELIGDIASGAFSVNGFKGGKLVSVESINRPADHLEARKRLTV